MSGKATEQQRAAFYIRPERVSVRLKRGFKKRLHNLARRNGVVIAEQVETMIDSAERKP